jgi:hypothetical protein
MPRKRYKSGEIVVKLRQKLLPAVLCHRHRPATAFFPSCD